MTQGIIFIQKYKNSSQNQILTSKIASKGWVEGTKKGKSNSGNHLPWWLFPSLVNYPTSPNSAGICYQAEPEEMAWNKANISQYLWGFSPLPTLIIKKLVLFTNLYYWFVPSLRPAQYYDPSSIWRLSFHQYLFFLKAFIYRNKEELSWESCFLS